MLNEKQWQAVAVTSTAVAFVGGPVAAGFTAIGAAAGCAVANKLGWQDNDAPNPGSNKND